MRPKAELHRRRYERVKQETLALPLTSYYLEGYMSHLDCSPALREAAALLRLWEECEMSVWPEELLVGNLRYREPVYFHYGSGTTIHEDNVLQYIRQEKLEGKEKDAFLERVQAVRQRHYSCYTDPEFDLFHPGFYIEEQRAGLDTGAAGSTFFGGHMVLDFETLTLQGLKGYVRKVGGILQNDPDNEFYQAMELTLEAFQTVIRRTAQACRQAAAGAEETLQANMLGLAEDLDWIEKEPPQTFRQALQLVWLAHLCADCDSFGRLDQYLYRFYLDDLRSGKFTREEIAELLEALMIKVDEQAFIQNLTLGGLHPDGSPAYNELTVMVLEACRTAGFKGPNLCLRIHPSMPREYWEEITLSLGTGQGLPALYNDEVMIHLLVESGIPQQDANDYCLAGCSQVMIPGRCQFVNDIGMMNAAKILELTLYNGVDRGASGLTAGLKSGEPDSFLSFEDLMSAYKRQLSYFAGLEAQVNNLDIALRGKTEGYVFRSLLTQDCLKKGRGIFEGGARYNNIELECIGITNAADSLAAIREMVFEKQEMSLSKLTEILAADFEGEELLRLRLKNRMPKVGNDDDRVDLLRKEISDHLFRELRAQPALMGGVFVPGEVIFIAHESMGKLTGATPDGRKKGEVLADSAGASQGRDQKGPTALMNSLLKSPPEGLVTSIVLNLKFLQADWNTARPQAGALLRTFFARGGQQLQINVCDNELLRKAYENPADYPNLVIRVGGYSAYFTSLTPALQKEILERTCNGV